LAVADRYLAVLAVLTARSRADVTADLQAAWAAADLDWSQVAQRPARQGQLLLMPPAVAGRLAGGLLEALQETPRPALRLGLAAGMCQNDGRVWYGDPIRAALRLAESIPDDVAPPGALAVTDELYRSLGDALPFTELGDHWVRGPLPAGTGPQPPDGVAAEVAARTPPGSPVRLLAEVTDEIARPLIGLLDDLPDLLSPASAPHDVLAWMYGALGVDAPMLLTDDRGRRLLAGLVRCYRSRGTARGLAELLELRYGVGVEVSDPGGTTWSAFPSVPAREPAAPVTVVLDTDEPLAGLDEVIRSALPAGVGYRVARRAARTAG
jgi:phage tail-like protein